MKPITQKNNRLGFIGNGYVGRLIVRKFLESGFKLTAYNRNRSNAQDLIQYGGKVAQSVSELSSGCNVVLSCLATDEAVLDIYRGPDGIFAKCPLRLGGHRPEYGVSGDLAATFKTGFRAWS
jgi:3-hydroxyisobutyrate dehydrogenase-like beta-hydroxyacid dehydrogenase